MPSDQIEQRLDAIDTKDDKEWQHCIHYLYGVHGADQRGLFEEVVQKPPQSGTAYHSVRGYFKTYREKPRFGRDDGYGTFWIPEHHRGTDTIGVINKDYRIHPDRDED